MEKDIILNGVHIGEHSFEPDAVIQEIYERCVKPGHNFVTIRIGRSKALIPQETILKWVSYMAENKIYFVFLYSLQSAPEGCESHFDADTVAKMKEIAGAYFIGDMIGETGGSSACWYAEYPVVPGQAPFADMEQACRTYMERVRNYAEIDRKLGMPELVSVEATTFNKYNVAAGVTIPMLEMMCGNPDIQVSALRGTARAYDSKMWGTYVAHEWYGGMRHDDMLKRKRLQLAYKYAYLAGTQALCLESGDELVTAYGYRFAPEDPVCRDYQDILRWMTDFIQKDTRPKGGPKVKVAFVSGRYDAWCGWGASSLWNQFYREEWGHSDAEHSWRLLSELSTKRTWEDPMNYGDHDLSAAPAYGMYDIIPAEAPVEKLARYDYLIFVGWNSMTEEIMDNLTEYVRQGGHLLMGAAHLNTSASRKPELKMVSNEKIEALFGCRYTDEEHVSNAGVKFRKDGLNPDILYPGAQNLLGDPIYSSGYVRYGKFALCGGTETAFCSQSFTRTEGDYPVVIENKIGSGVATLVTALDYPGNNAFYPLYRGIAREYISASARNCEIQVIASDRLRWSVYEGNKLYLLNTDYDLPIAVKILHQGQELTLTLDALELRTVQL